MADPKQRAAKYQGRQPGSTAADPERAKQLKAKGLTQREVASALNVSLLLRVISPAERLPGRQPRGGSIRGRILRPLHGKKT